MGLLRLKVRFGMLRSKSANCVREVALEAESTLHYIILNKYTYILLTFFFRPHIFAHTLSNSILQIANI